MPLDVHCYWNQLSLPLPNTCSPHHRHNVGCLFVVAVFGNNSCCLGGLCLLLSNVATCSGFQIQQIFARALLLLFERSIIPAACTLLASCPCLLVFVFVFVFVLTTGKWPNLVRSPPLLERSIIPAACTLLASCPCLLPAALFYNLLDDLS